MNKRYYIAYGSNLNVQQMRLRCPNARVVGTGWLTGWQLLFKGSGSGAYLTIERAEDGRVPVGIWEVTAQDETMLDRYEGYPHFYDKQELPLAFSGIRTGKTRRQTCFVYIMHEGRSLGLPSRRYIDTCRDGYDDFGFDHKYLIAALGRTMEGLQ